MPHADLTLFIVAYPGIALSIITGLGMLVLYFAREDVRRMWAAIKGKDVSERRRYGQMYDTQLHEVVANLDRTVSVLTTTLGTLEKTVKETNKTVTQISTEIFTRLRAVEGKITHRDSVCDTMGEICPNRRGAKG